MRKFVLTLVAMMIAMGCESTQKTNDLPPITLPNGPITIRTVIPYRAGAAISSKVKTECKIDEQLSEYIQSYSKDEGIEIIRRDHINPKDSGLVLVIEITDVINRGNAFLGHHKSTEIQGVIYHNGQRKGSFVGERLSRGGFGAGFKGSCSVLGRTVQALGKDVAKWLKNPVDGISLGDH